VASVGACPMQLEVHRRLLRFANRALSRIGPGGRYVKLFGWLGSPPVSMNGAIALIRTIAWEITGKFFHTTGNSVARASLPNGKG
jgi:hypothetical protein